MKELGIDEDNSSNQNQYVSAIKSKSNIVNQYETFLKQKFNIILDSGNMKLPHMYWLPKLHKVLSNDRIHLVVAATTC